MTYKIPFKFHDKENFITVDYNPMPDPYEPGFHILNLPFDPAACIGYPMLHAHFENLAHKKYID